ncbi:Crp/Fnr family transcriptional regulator [bacterium]|nr:Crp/Fnr family transcriptional regulator [bacterium]
MAVLKKVDIFAGLKEKDLKKIHKLAIERSVRRGEYVFLRGTFGKVLYIIVEGLIKIEQPTERGRVKTLALLGSGECFGEMAIVTNLPRSASAIAIEETRLLMLKREVFLDHLQNNPAISLRIIEVLCQRLTEANEQIKSLTFDNVPARLANTIVSLAEKFGEQEGGSWRIRIRLTHQELSDMVGSTREIVTRTLKLFQDEGSVEVDGERTLWIRDSQKLAQWIK